MEDYDGVDKFVKQRIITAIIGIIIVAPIIIYGNWPFIVLAYLLATIALFEMFRMYHLKLSFFYFFIATIALWSILLPLGELTFMSIAFSKLDLLIILTIVLLVATVVTKNKFTINETSFILFATLYVGFSFYLVIDVRTLGLNHFLFILFTIWSTDTGAYFIGKFFGKRKLWPAISPNKTIAGAFGGIVFALVLASIFQFIYPFERPFLSILLIATFISMIGQIGDLVASAMKRQYEIKDFGNIFPGHGGVLDRLDSFLFVLLVLYVFQII